MKTGSRAAKPALMALIEVGYAAGYGPSHLALVTGLSRYTIHGYARDLGICCKTTRPQPPAEPPHEVLIALWSYHRLRATSRISAEKILARLVEKAKNRGGAVRPANGGTR